MHHVEMEELKVGFNHMRKKSGLHSNFHCDYEANCEGTNDFKVGYIGFHVIYPSITTLWQAIVCPKDSHSEWHAQDCLFGTCEDCGLAFCLDEEKGTSSNVVCWKCFGMENFVTKKGEEKEKIETHAYGD